jgi:chromosome segregation ATPase
MEIIQNEKYEMNTKLLNAESDLLSINVREEKALKSVQELQDRMKELSEEKRELEIEFVSLKKNYLNCHAHLEAEKAKSENIGLELINVVNENKSLH